MKGRRTIKEYVRNGSFTVLYHFNLLKEVKTTHGHIVVGHNELFGNMLFFNDEIQITQNDYKLFHDVMVELGNLENVQEILIVGDGDGGFTQYDWSDRTVYVERDVEMLKIGESYFGADWSKPKMVHEITFEEFEPTEQYDAIVWALTDCFYRKGIRKNLEKAVMMLKNNGILVSFVGCKWDYYYESILADYLDCNDLFTSIIFKDVYIPTFFSDSTFFMGTK